MCSIKPFIKWVGGKQKIVNNLVEKFPENIDTYYEPFLGGGSVLLYLLILKQRGLINIREFKVNDINPILINCYILIKDKCDWLISQINILKKEYIEAKKEEQSVLYYKYREEFNYLKSSGKQLDRQSILFIYLNKTGFRGLYRLSKKGVYNVPFGNYKSPSIIDSENIQKISKLLHKYKVSFSSQDYKSFLETVSTNDFVYLDPPYYPLNLNSFTSYDNTNIDYKKFMKTIYKLKGLYMISNHDIKYLKEKFSENIISYIQVRRAIHSKNPGNSVKEILIRNFLNLNI
uniref:site-specific DNA-methyltransferase (adenine-specific) n=1 Tax=Iridovirus LCIVAC01 TaxID=2506607 RepID=A0A481YPQ4_9VIRU|nr:MAG: adenine-specific DNA methyltransferase [Iridovirus LCIVAC01]